LSIPGVLALVVTFIAVPQIEGSLDKEIVRRQIRARLGAIVSCLERTNALGGASLSMTIEPTGRVTLHPAGFTPRTAACLERIFATMRFPAPKGGGSVHVRYPLLFSSTGEGAAPPPQVPERSTFSIDVDTGSYTLARRHIREGRAPRPEEIRVEEFINAFRYDYDPPIDGPFSIQLDGSRWPGRDGVHLLRIGIQARIVTDPERLPRNLVFLVDTSCSMTSSDRLDLAKEGMRIALGRLDGRDQVAITTYAGGVQVVLPPTSADRKGEIQAAIDRLSTGGATAMSSGLELAYEQATAMHRTGSVTRVLVMSDGDANVGATSQEAMLDRISGGVEKGVRLSTIGFGTGNYRDELMEQLADRGNGNYFYVDDRDHAAIVFGRDLPKMVEDVAEDVKVQIAFSPAVQSFRLIGYQNRRLDDRDFQDDAVDAGEIGSGHQATALYELVLGAGEELGAVTVRGRPIVRGAAAAAIEIRRTIERRRVDRALESAPADYRATVWVAAAAEILKGSAGRWTRSRVIEGLRAGETRELAILLEEARLLSSQVDGTP
jgi:Ca-activated chloride channel family protein